MPGIGIGIGFKKQNESFSIENFLIKAKPILLLNGLSEDKTQLIDIISGNNAVLTGSNCGYFGASLGAYISTPAVLNTIATGIKASFITPASFTAIYKQICGAYTSSSSRILLGVSSTGALSVAFGSGSASGLPSLTPSTYYECEVDWSTSNLIITLNGVEVFNDIKPSGSLPGVTFRVGDNNSTPVGYKIFNVAIKTASADLMNLPIGEGSGATAYDVSGNENHGTINGIATATFWSNSQDYFHRNLLYGFNLLGTVYVPASNANPAKDVLGNDLIYLPISENGLTNGAETKIKLPEVASLIDADLETNYLYNGSGVAQPIALAANARGENRIICDTLGKFPKYFTYFDSEPSNFNLIRSRLNIEKTLEDWSDISPWLTYSDTISQETNSEYLKEGNFALKIHAPDAGGSASIKLPLEGVTVEEFLNLKFWFMASNPEAISDIRIRFDSCVLPATSSLNFVNGQLNEFGCKGSFSNLRPGWNVYSCGVSARYPYCQDSANLTPFWNYSPSDKARQFRLVATMKSGMTTDIYLNKITTNFKRKPKIAIVCDEATNSYQSLIDAFNLRGWKATLCPITGDIYQNQTQLDWLNARYAEGHEIGMSTWTEAGAGGTAGTWGEAEVATYLDPCIAFNATQGWSTSVMYYKGPSTAYSSDLVSALTSRGITHARTILFASEPPELTHPLLINCYFMDNIAAGVDYVNGLLRTAVCAGNNVVLGYHSNLWNFSSTLAVLDELVDAGIAELVKLSELPLTQS